MIGTLAFTPSWLRKGKKEKWPVYHLRPGDLLERDEFEAEMEGRHRAGEVMAFQMRDAAIEGISALVEGNDGEALKDVIHAEFSGETLSPAEKARAAEVTDILAEHWPDYRFLLEQQARRNRILPTLAFRRWCDGWERVKGADGELLEFERGRLGEIPESVMVKLAPPELRIAGLEAYALQYGRNQSKN